MSNTPKLFQGHAGSREKVVLSGPLVPKNDWCSTVHIAWCWYFEFTLPRCDMCGGKRYKSKQTPLFSTVNAAYSGVRLELSYTSSALCLSGTTISSVRIVFVCFHIARCCIQAYVLPRIRFMVFCLCLLLWGPCQCLRHLLIYSSLQPHPQRHTMTKQFARAFRGQLHSAFRIGAWLSLVCKGK